jgi:hypothetical protein
MWIVVPELQLEPQGMEAVYRAAAAAATSIDTAGPVRRSWWCRSCAVGWTSDHREPCWSCEGVGGVETGAPRLCA